MPKYRIYDEDGTDAGEAADGDRLKPGDEIWTPDHIKVRVVDVLPLEDEDGPFDRALRVKVA